MALGDKSQDDAILRFVQRAGATTSWSICEVGCGYGRNLHLLRDAGFQPLGIEVNPQIAEAVRASGFECHHPDASAIGDKRFDLILMSHIIEHFDYNSLFKMMNHYLDRLTPGGYLIIATPLPARRFYDNFDHVKPYTPVAIEEVFGRRGLQVQFQSPHELELLDIWIRRRPLLLQLFPSLLRRRMSLSKVILGAINIFLVLLHIISFRMISTRDGWVGLYKKIS